MNFSETLAFYVVVGVAVAIAYAVVEHPRQPARHAASILAACLFWPLFLPLVLSRPTPASMRTTREEHPVDELANAIQQVERELDGALSRLDGWAGNVLQGKSDRLCELRSALVAQADRIRDIETLLAQERSEPATLDQSSRLNGETELAHERWDRSLKARQDNMDRLARLCRQARSDLLATLAWVRELVSMIHLARFTGAPAARAEELVAQIASAVESISTLTEHDATPPELLLPDVSKPPARFGHTDIHQGAST